MGQVEQTGNAVKSTKPKENIVEFKVSADIPPLSEMLNLNDFEAVAKKVMKSDAWAYYSSAADDEITVRENRMAFHRIWMKPR